MKKKRDLLVNQIMSITTVILSDAALKVAIFCVSFIAMLNKNQVSIRIHLIFLGNFMESFKLPSYYFRLNSLDCYIKIQISEIQ
jgi:hypothetical protein